MTQSLIGIEFETGGVLIKFTRTAAESGGALHVQEARYPAHSAPAPFHRHPSQDERFVIVEGAVLFRIRDTDRLARAGESVEIPSEYFSSGPQSRSTSRDGDLRDASGASDCRVFRGDGAREPRTSSTSTDRRRRNPPRVPRRVRARETATAGSAHRVRLPRAIRATRINHMTAG
jgi:Cupin domain